MVGVTAPRVSLPHNTTAGQHEAELEGLHTTSTPPLGDVRRGRGGPMVGSVHSAASLVWYKVGAGVADC